jgi:hypothetical protein
MRFQRPKKSGDVLAFAVLVIFGLVLLSVMFLLPTPQGRFNWGFGPQWDCGNHSPIDMSCQLKR